MNVAISSVALMTALHSLFLGVTLSVAAGLLYALDHYGTLDRATVLAPALRAAGRRSLAVRRSGLGRGVHLIALVFHPTITLADWP